MKIIIWSDFQCPYCYMGEKMLENVLGAIELKSPVEIEYKSYQLDPQAPEHPAESMTEHFMGGHEMDRAAAEQRMEKITEMAARVGLSYNLAGVKVCNTSDAHRLMKYAAGKLSPGKLKKLNFNLFKANFEENLLLSDHEVLAKAAEGVGLDRIDVLKMLESKDFFEDIKRDQEEIDNRPDFEFVPYMELDSGAVLQGVLDEPELAKWLTGAMDGIPDTPGSSGQREGCGPDGCSI